MGLTREEIKEKEDYIDKVALEVMKVMVMRTPPANVKDNIILSRLCYKQALVMWNTKKSLSVIGREINPSIEQSKKILKEKIVDKK